MTWITLAFKEWQRRPLRTGITAAGVAIATAALFSLLAFQRGYRDGIRLELERLGAHVLLAPKGCPYDAASMALHGASWPCYLKESYLQAVQSVAGAAGVAPVFMTAMEDGGGTQVVYVGVDTNILALKPHWHISGAFPRASGGLLLGAGAAQKYKGQIGATIELPGVRGRTASIRGILASTRGPDDGFIYLPLADAQQWFHHSKELTHILLRLKDPNDLDKAVSQLRGCDAGLSMNVVPLTHVFHTIQSLVNSTRLLLGCVALVGLLVAGTGVSNTLLMAVAERQRELGILRALGASRSHLFRLIWLETLQVCLSGAVAGVLIAYVSSQAVETWVRAKLPFAPAEALIQWEWWVAGACVACAVCLGSLAGFLPAWRAARLVPMVAIREGGGRL